MEYFILKPDKRAFHGIKVEQPQQKKGYSLAKEMPFEGSLPETSVIHIKDVLLSLQRWVDFVEYPDFLISEELYQIFSMYCLKLKNVPVFLYKKRTNEQRLYRIVLPETVLLKSDNPFKIEAQQLLGKEIVRTGGTLDSYCIASLKITESILKRNLTGIAFEKISIIETN